MIRRLLILLAALVVSLLGAAQPAEALAAAPSAVGAHTYDAPRYDPPSMDSASERGPPSASYAETTYDADDRWSRGASVRPHVLPTPVIYDYDDTPRFVRSPRSHRAQGASGGRVDAHAVAHRLQVAANAEAGSIRGVSPLRGSQNCVNCAIATDSTLGGAPMSALNFGPQPISVLEKVYGGTFKSVAGRSQIEHMLAEAGPGARGIVFGSRGTEVGHVFNAVNQRGTIRFLDGQSGGAASFDGFDGFMFLRTN